MKSSELLKNVRIEYENSVTINTGNFQNVKPVFRASATVPEGINPAEAKERLVQIVDAWLEAKVDAIYKELNG